MQKITMIYWEESNKCQHLVDAFGMTNIRISRYAGASDLGPR